MRVMLRMKNAAKTAAPAQLAKHSPAYDIVSHSLAVQVMLRTCRD